MYNALLKVILSYCITQYFLLAVVASHKFSFKFFCHAAKMDIEVVHIANRLIVLNRSFVFWLQQAAESQTFERLQFCRQKLQECVEEAADLLCLLPGFRERLNF